jgi:hypothetical protein
MFRIVKEIARDIAAIGYHFAAALILLSGFVACISAAVFITYLVLGDVAYGREMALSVLSLRGMGLGESLRITLETINYLSVGIIAVYALVSCASYLRSVSERPVAVVYEFHPDSRGSNGFSGPTVVNL